MRGTTKTRSAIIAGGEATRMDRAPKGLLEVGGRRIIDRLVDVMVEAFDDLPILVANAPDAEAWRPDLEVVRDLIEGAGPLGGLYTAVAHEPGPIVVVAWDMPFVTAPLLKRLAGGLEWFDAFLPESDGPRGVEPLCAGYRSGAAEAMERAIEGGRFELISWHHAVRVGRLPLEEVRAFGDPEHLFFNVNTPEDLAQAARSA